MGKKHHCAQCTLRKKAELNPKSLLGRLWFWHTKFCPGWKAYLDSKKQQTTHYSELNITTMTKITMHGNPLTLSNTQVKVGDSALDFTVTDKELGDVKLSDFKGKTIILSLFPSIDTPVCATQTRTFNQKVVNLSDDVVVLTISKDLPFALARFCAAEGIERVLTLSDYKTNDFGTKYGFLINELQLLARGVVVINKNGTVEYVEYVSEMTSEPNYDNVIDIVNKIK